MDSTGTLTGQQRYLLFGGLRMEVGSITQTDFGYTGQRANSYIKLLDYRARAYDPQLMRFLQPDTVVPGAANPQAFNRYSYGLNNPTRYTDPSGHEVCWEGSEPGRCLNGTSYIKSNIEGTYAAKVSGNWSFEEISLLEVALWKGAKLSGGAGNLNDVLRDALRSNGIPGDRVTFKRLAGDSSVTGNYHAAWCGDRQDRGCSPGAFVFSDNIFTSTYQQNLGELRRPAQLGLDDPALGIQVTMLHEMSHAYADARPTAPMIYWGWVDDPVTFDPSCNVCGAEARGESMATAIAIYAATGGGPYLGYQDQMDYIEATRFLWLATP